MQNWSDIHLRLSREYKEKGLEPKKLQTLALSAYLLGRDSECTELFERAHLAFLEINKRKEAIRCAFWLGLILLNDGEKSRGGGWIARGERLLSEFGGMQHAERGLFLIPMALSALYSGQVENAYRLFKKALTIGHQYADVDLRLLGRLGCGQSKIHIGKITEGVKLLDELMISLSIENIYPIAVGITYCAVIETFRKIWDLQRAQEWTLALTRWCESQPEMVPFRGQCLVRRAEVIQLHGEWRLALEEAKKACIRLVGPPGEPAAGEAFYRKAELYRLLGDFQRAEEGYRDAGKWGKNAQPGLALLRLSQGQIHLALTSIKNVLLEAKDIKNRAEILPAFVHILLVSKKFDEAHEAVQELDYIAGELNVPYLQAMNFHCKGQLYYEANEHKKSLENLQKAVEIWNAQHLPYEAAKTKEIKGKVYLKLDDRDNAAIHLDSAKWTFEQLGASPDLHRLSKLRLSQRIQENYGLTLRELQVLKSVVGGKTNKVIAAELFISDRTVDRHVSNIFNKLGVSSRVEAATCALKNNLLD